MLCPTITTSSHTITTLLLLYYSPTLLFKMVKFAALTLALAVAITGTSARCTKACVPGQVYCGYALLNDYGCQKEDLRNTKGEQYWDSTYTCATDAHSADEIEWCVGGNGHCQPPNNDHCDGINYCCF
ncbi:hypothetical protein PGQ11_007493 [Apiospora arundinis]|uniref:Uncharacterized protein n=1 Tax=Apiospora arundinis TaxID=335852 RepID=A0ABR2IVU7_9PEZI